MIADQIASIKSEPIRAFLNSVVGAADSGNIVDASVCLAGFYEGLRIHYVRSYRYAQGSDAPGREPVLPAKVSVCAAVVFPGVKEFSQEPVLLVDKHGPAAEASLGISTTSRRRLSDVLRFANEAIRNPGDQNAFDQATLSNAICDVAKLVATLQTSETEIVEEVSTGLEDARLTVGSLVEKIRASSPPVSPSMNAAPLATPAASAASLPSEPAPAEDHKGFPPEHWPKITSQRLVRVLSTGGGVGVVFLAEDPFAGTKAALKVCLPRFPDSKVDERFKNEATKLASLKHDQVVRYRTSGLTDDVPPRPFMLMDFVEGQLLKDMAGKLDAVAACKMISDILVALEYCHSKSVIHRDLKPANIILSDETNKPILVDFGLAIEFEALESNRLTTQSGGGVGTPGYMAPEVLSNFLHLDRRNDLYSVGVILFELIAGKRPNIQKIDSLDGRSQADARLDEIIRKALDCEDKRFSTAQEFRGALDEWLSSRTPRPWLRPAIVTGALVAGASTAWGVHTLRDTAAVLEAHASIDSSNREPNDLPAVDSPAPPATNETPSSDHRLRSSKASQSVAPKPTTAASSPTRSSATTPNERADESLDRIKRGMEALGLSAADEQRRKAEQVRLRWNDVWLKTIYPRWETYQVALGQVPGITGVLEMILHSPTVNWSALRGSVPSEHWDFGYSIWADVVSDPKSVEALYLFHGTAESTVVMRLLRTSDGVVHAGKFLKVWTGPISKIGEEIASDVPLFARQFQEMLGDRLEARRKKTSTTE